MTTNETTTTTPSNFNNHAWPERKLFLGYTAEKAFEKYATVNLIPSERFGQAEASPLKYITIAPVIRTQPDYLAFFNEGIPYHPLPAYHFTWEPLTLGGAA